MADLNTMTFGVEIECTIPAASMSANGWTVGGYHGRSPIPGFSRWNATRDGSIMPGPGHQGVEVVSPVLSGADGLAEVGRMVETIRNMGGKVNTSTGFHVHVGFDGAAVDALVRLIFLTANVENGLFGATGATSRLANHFCKSIKADFAPVQAKGKVRDLAGLGYKVSSSHDRYHTLNLANLLSGRLPTVEFRVFAGTLNALKAKAYVQLCLGLVQLALERPGRVKWNPVARPYHFSGGTYEAAVKQMFTVLGWSRANSRCYGLKLKAFGVLDTAALPAMKKLLAQLGRKLDGGGRRDDVTVAA